MKAVDNVRAGIDAIRRGEMVILVDDEGRENEGDLVIAAEHCDAKAINFMATHARGLICLAMGGELIDKLKLPMMVRENEASLGTAFTVSIEARDGVSTGISAPDRARTVEAAIADDATPTDLVSPGHIFPLRARDGGVLVRTGQTEGSVDLARLAGLKPAGVICEIMRDDGEMARMPELIEFAKTHGMRIISVADLVAYRLQTERIVRCDRTGKTRPHFLGAGQPFEARFYSTPVEDTEYVALIRGDVTAKAAAGEPVDVRVQSFCPIGDGLGVRDTAVACLRHIDQQDAGVFLYVVGAPASSLAAFDQDILHRPAQRPAPQSSDMMRGYGLGAQVLADIGCRKIRLLTNRERKLVGVEGFGIDIVSHVPLAKIGAQVPLKEVRS